MKKIFITFLILLPLVAKAQEEDIEIPFELDSVKTEDTSYDQTLKNSTPESIKEAEKKSIQKAVTPTAPQKTELTGLGNLSAFNDVAVITRRFLPKTNRFEFHPNVGMILNDAFFTNFDFGARLAYYFSEKYGLELIGQFISTTNKTVTTELAQRDVTTESLATAQSYYGLDFKWIPIYGKMGWLNKSIVPFDFYFSIGGGLTKTNQGTQPVSLHLGGGQMFALNKWLAIRWDISWYGYQTTSSVDGSSGTYTNLHATLGASIFFPGAEYR
ncbi:MAG: outer membrane beta-barrel domain-containing protein [Oligoflexia bacterium]|nr:outer membrane beta-barrel domain-containing protein [Oligoflexia bacterium]